AVRMRIQRPRAETFFISAPSLGETSAHSSSASTARIETGEPYIIYSDHVNNARPEHQKLAGLEVKTSNLCSEITLPTGIDQQGDQRTAVCCLSSLTLETGCEWKDE
ncbi:MAG: hypothetical protein ACK5NZ_01345, partial [bacterium]